MAGEISACVCCGRDSLLVSRVLGLCADCIKNNFARVLPHIRKVHAASQEKFDLPAVPPADDPGIHCDLCVNECRIGAGKTGFCGLRKNFKGKIVGPTAGAGYLSHYYDPLPTNCVGDWVCPGGTGAGYPEYSYSKSAEYGFKNLAVFYHGCSFNCLFCQNWHFREYMKEKIPFPAGELAAAADAKTSCICFFGGDPSSQLPHALQTSRLALDRAEGRILRICWETNGSMNPEMLKKMVDISLVSGGCVKFDLKTWDEKLHIALCGVSNKQTFENFALTAKRIEQREEPPLLIASTLLVPGYVDESEVSRIASFIAGLNPAIPYSLLGFSPQFNMPDLPRTSRDHAQKCQQAALAAGLKRVRIGNIYLLDNAY